MLSSVLMFTSVPMVVPRDQVLSLSSLQMMLATLFNNSTVMNGRVALLKSVKIVSPVLLAVVDSVAVLADLVLVVALEAASELEAGLAEAEVDSAVDLAVAAEVSEADSVEVASVVVVLLLELTHLTLQPSPTPSLTTLLPVLREVISSTFAT